MPVLHDLPLIASVWQISSQILQSPHCEEV